MFCECVDPASNNCETNKLAYSGFSGCKSPSFLQHYLFRCGINSAVYRIANVCGMNYDVTIEKREGMAKRNLVDEIIFTAMMSFTMAYVMELYNKSLMAGELTYELFIEVFQEVWWVTIIVFFVQFFWGGPLARKLVFSVVDPKIEAPIIVTLAMSTSTVMIMCPTMSLIATILFKNPWGNFIPIWLKTVAINFPMAFFWQNLYAGPLVRFLFKKIRKREKS